MHAIHGEQRGLRGLERKVPGLDVRRGARRDRRA